MIRRTRDTSTRPTISLSVSDQLKLFGYAMIGKMYDKFQLAIN